MKNLVTISLFIFWAAFTAILTAGLVFNQNKNIKPGQNVNQLNNGTNQPGTGQTLVLDTVTIGRHNSVSDCWLVINNKVYNISSYLSVHPGGISAVSPYCGQEATRAFDTKDIGRSHSGFAASLLAQYYIGDLNQIASQVQIDQNIQNTNSVIPPRRGDDNGGDD